MTLYADAGAFSATLAINLLLLGSPVAIGVAVAFRLIRLGKGRVGNAARRCGQPYWCG